MIQHCSEKNSSIRRYFSAALTVTGNERLLLASKVFKVKKYGNNGALILARVGIGIKSKPT